MKNVILSIIVAFALSAAVGSATPTKVSVKSDCCKCACCKTCTGPATCCCGGGCCK